MNLRDLKYLVAVADHGHFGHAAKACHVSQPGLSMQIQKLEAELGVQLLERDRGNVMVTEVGKDIVARAREVLQAADDIRSVALAHQNPLTGDLRLGAFPTLAPYFFPAAVPAIARAMPAVKLLLIEEKTDLLLARLKNGDLDAALVALPLEEPGLEYQPLFEDDFLLAVSQDHHLAKNSEVSFADFANEELLLLEEGHCLRAQALDVCRLAHTGEKQDFRATSLETLRQMVASGVGVTLMPELARRAGDGIVYLPFADTAPRRTIALTWRKTSARTPCFAKLAEVMRGISGPHLSRATGFRSRR